MTFYKIFLVGAGGMFGSILRYVVSRSIDERVASSFPYGTLAVNVTGSFILGFVYGWLAARAVDQSNLKLLLGAGFCGGFTTFSAFAYENAMLLEQKFALSSIVYVLATLLLGVLAVFGGLALGKSLSA